MFRSLCWAVVVVSFAGCAGSGGKESDGDTSATAQPVTCDEYCTTYADNCPTLFDYADQNDCLTKCATLDQGDVGVEDVNTLECRWVHAQEANDDDHCGEAAFDSTSCTG